MKTTPNKSAGLRKAIVTAVVLAFALAASLFATTTAADARPTDYQVVVDDDGRSSDQFVAKDVKRHDHRGPADWLCPAGTIAVAFDMPIYDDETGLFVVGYETVWFCIDADTRPAG